MVGEKICVRKEMLDRKQNGRKEEPDTLYVNMNTMGNTLKWETLKWEALKWYYTIIFYVVAFFTTYTQLTRLLFDILTPYRLRLPAFLAHKLIRVPWIFNLYRRHRTPIGILSNKANRWYSQNRQKCH